MGRKQLSPLICRLPAPALTLALFCRQGALLFLPLLFPSFRSETAAAPPPLSPVALAAARAAAEAPLLPTLRCPSFSHQSALVFILLFLLKFLLFGVVLLSSAPSPLLPSSSSIKSSLALPKFFSVSSVKTNSCARFNNLFPFALVADLHGIG